MADGGPFLANGSVKKIDNNTLLRLIDESNKNIDPVTATKAWRKAGLGVPLDGSLDDWIFEDDVNNDEVVSRFVEVQDRHTAVAQLSVRPHGKARADALAAQPYSFASSSSSSSASLAVSSSSSSSSSASLAVSSSASSVASRSDRSPGVEVDDGREDEVQDDAVEVDIDGINEQLAREV